MTTCLNSPDTIDNHTLEPMSYSEALLYQEIGDLQDIDDQDAQSNVKTNSLCGRRSWGGYSSPGATSHEILFYELPSPPSYLDAISTEGGGSLPPTGAFGILRRSVTDRDLASRVFAPSNILDRNTRWSPETLL